MIRRHDQRESVMPDQGLLGRDDRELELVVTNLQRLVLRVESRFDPDITEGADPEETGAAADEELVLYARRCLEVLDDPGVTARLLTGQSPRW
jgi:hypothetical protein